MSRSKWAFFKCCMGMAAIVACLAAAAWAEPAPDEIERIMGQLDWQEGPCQQNLGQTARIMVPEGSVFLNGDDTRTFMTIGKNLTNGLEVGLVISDRMWLAHYSFDDVGYVRDDEKDSLDADAMLKSIREGVKEGNQERRKRGWEEMEVVGWARPPHYDEQTHNLEWALKFTNSLGESINHNTRILGRRGMMVVTLAVEPEEYEEALPWFRALQEGFSYVQGQRYSEFRDGDKVAKVGLTALVVGGATAAAVKSGLFKWIWKGLVFVVLAIVGFFRRLFGGRKQDGYGGGNDGHGGVNSDDTNGDGGGVVGG